MARRRSEPKVDYRQAPAFYAEFIGHTQGFRAYVLLEPFPIPVEEWGRFFDSMFGLEPLCRVAAKRWESYAEATQLQARMKLPLHHPKSADVGSGLIPKASRVFRIGDICFRLVFPSAYPCENAHMGAYLFDQTQFLPAYLEPAEYDAPMPEEAARKFETLKGWLFDAFRRKQEVLTAMQFLHNASQQAKSSYSLLRALPGLGQLARMTGMPNSIIHTAEQPYRGKDFFDDLRMSNTHPFWRTLWADTVRPTFLRALAARRTDDADIRLSVLGDFAAAVVVN